MDEDVEYMAARMKQTELQKLLDTYSSAPNTFKDAFTAQLQTFRKQDRDEQEAKKQKRINSYVLQLNSFLEQPESSRPWTEEELSQLARALAKYPVGTRDRWQLVATFLGTRTEKEVIAKVKDGKSGKRLT